MTTESEKDYVKKPTFDGKRSSWEFYSKKFESALARLDLAHLLLADSGEDVKPDSHVPTAATREAVDIPKRYTSSQVKNSAN